MTSEVESPTESIDPAAIQTFSSVVQIQINAGTRLVLLTGGDIGLIATDDQGQKSLFLLGHGRAMLIRLREASEQLLLRIN